MDRPFVRILAFYLSGCVVASQFAVGAVIALASLVLACLSALAAFITKGRERLSVWCLALALVIFGMSQMWIALLPDPMERWAGQDVRFEGFITYQPHLAPDTSTAVLDATLWLGDETLHGTVWFITHEPLPNIGYGTVYSGNGELRLPSPRRNPGGYDQRTALARKGIHAVLAASKYEVATQTQGHPVLHWLERRRHRVEALLDASVNNHPERASVLRGILLGQRKRIPESVLESIQASGLFHIFAVSGLHVGCFAASVFLLLGFIRPLPERWRISATIFMVLIYAALVGFRPSVVRATIMIELVLVARWIYRDHDVINLLALAAWVLLVWNPRMFADIGFQLSFLVTGSILLFVPRWWESIKARWPIPRPLALVVQTVLVSCAAQLASQPLIAYYFSRVYLYGPLANLSAALLVWWIVITSFLSVLGGAIWTPLAGFLGHATELGLIALIWLTERLSHLPAAMPDVTQSQAIALFTLPLAALAATYWRSCLRHWQRTTALASAWLVVMLWWGVWPTHFQGLEVTFLDVGQGDAICIRFPDHKVLLIDTGPRSPTYDAGERVIAPYLLHENIRTLDAVLITHQEQDHLGGLKSLQEHFDIRKIIGMETIPPLGPWLFSSTAEIEIQHPSPGFLVAGNPKKNNRSIVVRIRYGEIALLFTGDIEQAVEEFLCHNDLDLRSTILKVAHHGSQTSSAQTFLNVVDPQLAVISCGHDRRGHFPSSEVLKRFEQLGSQVLRTDLCGAIRIRTDGHTCWTETTID